ncbi:5-oxoprolinase subunit B family protein [Pseudomonas typographi]|uniref:Carboxyltransferase domain-containing protein n=1 Tax=Pseudomonas typographi TaxID=2715964 RepID=A0ABR7Z0Q0_9PSED|nr:carboxyltransferase domain-containing protein [Pseudomonas typographi]MBD1550696.1 carboxyltransferase domain-containing protein [Pseudomonas typographi]MBD1589305.1 carboxyltransferase domain-containing protein [Pseudomonas typographi]MBD1598982.1 carboxyltransferase domain-containing protein [Pseudomonas typographi]
MKPINYAPGRQAQVEVVAIDGLMLRLFEAIDEANVPWLLAAAARVRGALGEALVDLVPAYTTLYVQYDLARLDAAQAHACLARALAGLAPEPVAAGQEHVVPVWYDPSVGPELPVLAARSGLGVPGLIARHCGRAYTVFALGFTPGFAFMGLVEPVLAAPRLATPRQRVPAGSVGIGERQTAIYPSVSPGGWNLLGRTPWSLVDAQGTCRFSPGDRVRFEAVGRDRFVELGGDCSPLEVRE